MDHTAHEFIFGFERPSIRLITQVFSYTTTILSLILGGSKNVLFQSF